MHYRQSLLFITAIILFSCKKEKQIIDPPSPPLPKVLIKDVALDRLPSPYYHFGMMEAG